MKPPVNLDALHEEWAQDSKFDLTELAQEVSRIPVLHSKYLSILSYHRIASRKFEHDYMEMKKLKWEYYSGRLNSDTETLSKYKWEPERRTILRQDIPMHLESDSDLSKILLKKALHDEIVEVCTSIIKELSNRTWQTGNAIKYIMFTQGR